MKITVPLSELKTRYIVASGDATSFESMAGHESRDAAIAQARHLVVGNSCVNMAVVLKVVAMVRRPDQPVVVEVIE